VRYKSGQSINQSKENKDVADLFLLLVPMVGRAALTLFVIVLLLAMTAGGGITKGERGWHQR
jgi:Mn2+/Fe2+ NRAMP family transporter